MNIPAHIAAAGIVGTPIDFAWDEANTRDYYWDRVSEPLRHKLLPMSPVGELALAAGIAEWLIWRFEGMSDLRDARDYVTATWAAVIDLRYLVEWVEPHDRALIGPVLKSQWITAYLLDDVFVNVQRRSPCEYQVGYLAFFANHVLGHHKAFRTWLEQALVRVAELSPIAESAREWFKTTLHTPEQIATFDSGTPLPRAALDTTRPYDMADAPAELDAFLRGLDPARNRFLVGPEQLRAQGMANPYRYPST